MPSTVTPRRDPARDRKASSGEAERAPLRSPTGDGDGDGCGMRLPSLRERGRTDGDGDGDDDSICGDGVVRERLLRFLPSLLCCAWLNARMLADTCPAWPPARGDAEAALVGERLRRPSSFALPPSLGLLARLGPGLTLEPRV